ACAAGQRHVLPAGSLPGTFECRLDAVGDKRERGAFELERRTRVVRENEHRVMERRTGTPPSVPRIPCVPGAWMTAKHVASHHGGADVRKRFLDDRSAFV